MLDLRVISHTEWLALRQEINDWALTKSTSTAMGGEQDFWCRADLWLKASIVLGHLGEADKDAWLEVNAEAVPNLELLNSQLEQTHTFSLCLVTAVIYLRLNSNIRKGPRIKSEKKKKIYSNIKQHRFEGHNLE